jgi:hypothetical protein
MRQAVQIGSLLSRKLATPPFTFTIYIYIPSFVNVDPWKMDSLLGRDCVIAKEIE